MKLNGINGTGSGKLGSAVWSVKGGQQIVRQYQPDVANPNTQGQIESRSKMKLLSQLAAVAAPVIAIPSEGLKSSRNLFISKNYELSGYENDYAFVQLPDVQLTNSVISNPGFDVDRSSSSNIYCTLLADSTSQFDRVIYVAFVRDYNGSLRLWDTAVATEAGADGLFPANLKFSAGTVVVYCYGIRDNSEAARTKFGNMHTISAESIAKVITSKTLTLADITLSDTAGIQLNIGEDSGSSGTATSVSITVNPATGGTVTGGGRKEIGESVTLTATPAEGYEFIKWKNADTNTDISTNNPYTFTAAESIKIAPVFQQLHDWEVTASDSINIDSPSQTENVVEFTIAPASQIDNTLLNQIDIELLGSTNVSMTHQQTYDMDGAKHLVFKLTKSGQIADPWPASLSFKVAVPANGDYRAFDQTFNVPVVVSE